MTTVCFSRKGNVYEFFVRGHAGYAQPGREDIVCAAVSVLGYTLLQALREAEKAGVIRCLTERIRSGDLEARFESQHHGTANAIVNTILCGYRLVEERYPDFCRVLVQDGGEKDFRT